jgi:amino acid adenylation domain-containing protein
MQSSTQPALVNGPSPPGSVPELSRPFPLSFGQERLWFLDRLAPGDPGWNVPLVIRVRGPLSPAVLESCFGKLIRRHEVLRTVFEGQAGEPVQRIARTLAPWLPLVDLRALPEDARAAEERRLTVEEIVRPFDLARGPLLRTTLLRLAQEEHALLLSLHHIVCDGWSLGVLVDELGSLYDALSAGIAATLPPLPIQYVDFASWQRQVLRSKAAERQIAYWRERLGSEVPRLDLPARGPRPPLRPHRGGVERLVLDESLVARLREMARREHSTWFTLLLTAFQILLARYADQPDVAVGVPISGRSRPELERLIGFFLNTLVLRTDLSGTPSWREALARVREVALGAYANADLPFEALLSELRPERSLSEPPLFQTMLNVLDLRGIQADRLNIRELQLEMSDLPEASAKLDITLYAREQAGGVLLELVYARDLFDLVQVARMLGHFRNLLADAADDPHRRISELSLTSEAERRELSRRKGPRPSQPAVRFSAADVEQTIPAHFEYQASLCPTRVAVRSRRYCWTYADLDRRVQSIARRLQKTTERKPGLVALLFLHDAPMIAALLGTLRAGRAYVPLDATYPESRLAEMAADAGIAALLTESDLRETAARLVHSGLPVILIDEPGDPGESGEEPVPVRILPDEVAYVLYTSGSSGRPKGVAQSHRNLLHHIRCYTEALHLGPEDRLSLLASYSFDAAVMDIFGALLNGAALHVIDVREEGLLRLGERLRAERVTVYHSTPTLFRALCASVPNGESFPDLRLVVLGGEEALRDDLRRFRALTSPDALLINGLGPTESTLALQSFWGHDSDLGRPSLPVGWPVEGTQVLLINGMGEQWAVYGIGEIVIGSHHVALGYWNRPGLTRQAFSDDEKTGLRRYRTGDLGRRLPDGSLEFVCRRDLQVKIRGYRIEVAEVESRLRALPGIQEAVVAARTDPAGEQRLVAWLLHSGGEALKLEELRVLLATSLPEPMIPSAAVSVDSFPLTPTGKVDRRALPQPVWERTGGRRPGDRPPTSLEEVVAGLWEEVVDVESVGLHDDFFALGGHSLLATRVAARLRQVLGVELPLRTFFEALTVADLARRIEAAQGAETPPSPPLEASPRLAPEPLSFAQERFWFLDQLESGSLHNLPTALRLRGPLDPSVLEAALREIVRRHEILRTRYSPSGGEPRQIVDLPGLAGLPMADLSSLPAVQQESEASRQAAVEARRPFDLSRGPVIRALLLRLDAEDHRVVVTMHHIAGDGWSVGVLLREAAAFYRNASRSVFSPLPPLPIQYADFARWQRSWITGDLLAKEIAFWKKRLAGAPQILELPTDHPRPAVQRHRGLVRRLDISPGFTAGLRALGRAEGVSLFMILVAAFCSLLSRHSGQEEISLGSPVAGRTRAELEGLIGPFINTLVLRLGLPPRRTFLELLAHVRETVLEAQAHQHVPFERLVKELPPERSLSHAPLFQAMLTLLSSVQPRLENAGFGAMSMEPWIAAETGAEKVDLTLAVSDLGEGLGLLLSADADLFEGVTVERLLERLLALMEGVVEKPDRPLEDLTVLTTAERFQLSAWSDGGPASLGPDCLHHLVMVQAFRTPEGEAVVGRDSSLSYRELLRRSGTTMAALQNLGIGPESRVGLALDRSPETVGALLGVLRAGGCWVPLDPAYPRERLAWVIEDAGLDAFVTRRSLLPFLPATGVPVVLLEEIPEDMVEVAPAREPLPENLAYVLYTSGSTGRPKAVALEHRNAVALIRWAQQVFPEEETRGMLASTSLNFDLSLFEIFLPLSCGGVVFLAENALHLPDLRRAAEVTFVNTVPSAALELLESGDLPPSVRAVALAGEPLPGALARNLLKRGVKRVYNLYGPSEDTTYSTWHLIDSAFSGEPPIGHPIAGTRAWILDFRGQVVPPGTPGELFLGGAGLARGYMGRPDLTAERFVPDAFGDGPGWRLYRTGDRVRFRLDGAMEFLGRLDHQIKLRGYRIELEEVEAALTAIPQVLDAAAGVRKTAIGNQHLVAWLAFRPGETMTPAEVRENLRQRLPDPMVPDFVIAVEALPRTPNGKLDRGGLVLPEPSHPGAESVSPRTPVEDLIARIWSGVLGLPRVGIDDDFFALGGHSLLATRVVARIRATVGVELPLRRIFESRTVAALTREVEALRKGVGPTAPPLSPNPRAPGESAPLSFEQERLWIVDRIQGDSPIYHLQVALRLYGRLSCQALKGSLAQVIRRHEVLHSALLEGAEGLPVQKPLPSVSVPLPVIDVALEGSDRSTALAREIAQMEQRRPFHLDRPPLLRALLVHLGADDHVLLITMHHIVSDGWSLDLLIREVTSYYEATVTGSSVDFPALPIQYADYAIWQRRRLQGEALDALLGAWRRRLAGAPPALDLPLDRPRPAVASHRGAHLHFELAPERVSALRGLSGREGLTPFLILAATFEALLGRLSGQEDFCLGTVVSHREWPEVQDLIGFFVNTLVLRCDLSADPEFRSLLGRVREDALDAFDHQDLPFEKVVEALQPARALDRSPVFQVALVYQGFPPSYRVAAGLEMVPFPVDSGVARFDLTLFAIETEEGFNLSLEYACDLFEHATALRLVEQFDHLLKSALENESRLLSELPLLGEPERHQLCWEWNGSCRAYPRESRVEALFSQQALQRPEAVALEAPGGRWTYGELESRSNRLGRRLRELGVGPEVAVAVCLERSAEAILALLGILKAGGAYVPIDPGYPAPRQELLVADAQARVLLTRPGLLRAVPGADVQVIDLEEAAFADLCSAEALDPQGWAESLAYVMYTSGSTGRPKGVAVTHRGIVRLVKENDYADLGPEQTWLQLAPLSFDASTLEIWGALLNGGRLVVAPSGLPSLEQVGAWVRHSNVTSLWLTAGLFHQVVEGDLSPLSGLRQLLAGGDVLSAPHVRRALDSLPECTIINGYGPTEATTFTCCHWMDSPSQVHDPVPIGRPIAHGRVAVVDGWGAPAPLGVPGELWIGGDGLARGYQGQAERTAERFVPDPFGASGERLYRTGDLARWRRDGTLDFLGRIDAQLKIRGYRIEPGEIEAALSQLPGVSACAVLAQDDRAGRRLVAHLTGHGDTETVREALRRRLPEYMVPSAFVWLERLPLTPNGKIDRRQLAKQTETPDASPAVFLPPQTPVEIELARLWRELLGLESVGIRDSFFDLGGHSLVATRLASRIRETFGVEISFPDFFSEPTIEALDAFITEAKLTDLDEERLSLLLEQLEAES